MKLLEYKAKIIYCVNAILQYLKQWLKSNRLFILTCIVGLVVYLLISISKHIHFGSTGFDLVIFDQAIRHYSEFVAPASSFRGYDNLLGDHFHPILALLAPLYWLFDSPITLLIAQAVLIISTCLPIYLYAKKKLGVTPAVFLIIAFIFNAALLRAIYFDFHEIAFAIPLIAWAIYFIDRKMWLWFYVSIILLLLVKEDMSILVAFLGIYLMCLKQYRRGAVMVVAGVMWFFLTTKFLIPYFAGGDKSFNYWSYDQLGADLPSSIVSIVKNPLFAASLLFIPLVKIITLIKTFGVFLGLTFFSPIILLAVPLILERFLSSSENYWQFNYHYGATLVPILLMAVIDSLGKLRGLKLSIKLPMSKITKTLSLLLALIAIILFFFSPMNFIFNPANYSLSKDERSGYSMLNAIPKNASVCTTNHIAPHLGKHDLTLIGFDSSVINLKCYYIITSVKLDQSSALNTIIGRASSSGYNVISQNNNWTLYKK